MGSFDTEELRRIIVLHLLNKLSILLGKDSVGFYKGDGLAVISICIEPVLKCVFLKTKV